ncbi:hypothetical protein LX94_00982 [Mameliella alba]|nr:hypothetical protein LX94_00982 [Mameliella alba]
MGGWRDVEPNHIVQFPGEGPVVRQLELTPAVRAQPMRLAHPPDRAMRRLMRLRFLGQADHFAHLLVRRPRSSPRRVFSRSSPSKPSAKKRSCHRHTQVLEFAVVAMIDVVPAPSALRSTMRQRRTCFWGEEGCEKTASSRDRSLLETEKEIPVCIRMTRTANARMESQFGLLRRVQSTRAIIWHGSDGQVGFTPWDLRKLTEMVRVWFKISALRC